MSAVKKVLVVDDDIDALEQACLVLAADGLETVTAGGQGEAEEALLSCVPDLCIVDLMMESPDSGFVLCHTIKRLYPGTPVILLTAVRASTGLDLDPGAPAGARWIEADALLDKPVRPEQLRGEVRRLLEARR